MTKRMLIDSTHAEETRVVLLDGSRLEDFDVETAAKKQLKGNIYLAKVVRVEPSLQAAFVEYGGGRHGFLAFGEIHPDYYQIPVADRQRLLEMQEAEARAEEEAEDAAAEAAEAEAPGDEADDAALAEPATFAADLPDEPVLPFEEAPEPLAGPVSLAAAVDREFVVAREEFAAEEAVESSAADTAPPPTPIPGDPDGDAVASGDGGTAGSAGGRPGPGADTDIVPQALVDAVVDEAIEARLVEPAEAMPDEAAGADNGAEADSFGADSFGADSFGADGFGAETGGADGFATHATDGEAMPSHPAAPLPETLNGAAADETDDDTRVSDVEEAGNSEQRPLRPPARYMRSYKIQEVIRRRQILLVQVVKEERGTKGAALTTFISLAGRFSVLMPNSPRGGGISRKITSAADRRRLKEVTAELQIPRGMGLIVRTAGAARPKAEIKRDCEYLLELWDSIRETTMASIAPALIHEEASLIKRSIRDNYSRDVEEVVVDGESGWRAARDFMRMLMPAHARKVILWNEPLPLFSKNNVEAQLDAMLEPTVQLRSGGYLVINQTEALVAIDVNSGRSTRERGIEETALKTNLEAADEVARQLRLRDLAGLIVIDFIDMESRRNNAAVEKRIKDALRDDRARIQLGSISHFGLLELSRQRLRPSLAETSFTICPHCGGTGHVRTTEMAALAVLRAVEEEGAKRRAAAIVVHVAGAVALYILNNKRVRLAEIEARHGMEVLFAADESLLPPQVRIERTRAKSADAPFVPPPMPALAATPEEDDLAEEEADADEDADADADGAEAAEASPRPGESAEEADRSRKRRRRRRGGRREDGPAAADPGTADQPDTAAPLMADMVEPALDVGEPDAPAEEGGAEAAGEETAGGRRRGRRGGRRRRREPGEADAPAAEAGAEQASSFDGPAPVYAYTGPTPADPFGGSGTFDIFDILDATEERAAPAPAAAAPMAPVSPEPPPVALADGQPAEEGEAAEATLPREAAEQQEPAVILHAEPTVEHHFEPEPTHHFEPAPLPELVAELVAEPVLIAEAPPAEAPPAEAPAAAAEVAPPALNGHTPPDPAGGAEPVSAPVPPPLLVGSVPPPEKKRGWWKR